MGFLSGLLNTWPIKYFRDTNIHHANPAENFTAEPWREMDRAELERRKYEAKKLLLGHDPQPGEDWALPHIITEEALYTGGWYTYWHEIYDEAMRHSRQNALAMANDEWIQACLWERIRGVTGLKWHLEIENPRDPWQCLVRDALARCVMRSFRLRRLFRQLSWALWSGRAGTQCLWEWDGITVETPRGTEECKMLRLASHLPVNGDKIGYGLDHVPYILIFGGNDEILGDAERIWTTKSKAVKLTGSWRDRFLIHQVNVMDADYDQADRADMIHGIGIRNWLYWSWYLKNEYITSTIKSLDRFGLGFVVIEYDAGNEKAKLEAMDAAQNLSTNRSIMVVPVSQRSGAGGAVRVVETPVAGAQILLTLQEACEKREERFIIAQTGSSRSESSGLGTHDTTFMEDTKSQLLEEDANDLSETITGSEREPGLISIIKKWSFPWADFPVRFVFDVRPPDSERKLGAVTMAYNVGVGFIEGEVRALTGLSDPGPNDAVLKNPQIVAANAQMQQAQPPDQSQGGGGGGMENASAQVPDDTQAEESEEDDGTDPNFNQLFVPQVGPKGGHWLVDPRTGEKRHADATQWAQSAGYNRVQQPTPYAADGTPVGGIVPGKPPRPEPAATPPSVKAMVPQADLTARKLAQQSALPVGQRSQPPNPVAPQTKPAIHGGFSDAKSYFAHLNQVKDSAKGLNARNEARKTIEAAYDALDAPEYGRPDDPLKPLTSDNSLFVHRHGFIRDGRQATGIIGANPTSPDFQEKLAAKREQAKAISSSLPTDPKELQRDPRVRRDWPDWLHHLGKPDGEVTSSTIGESTVPFWVIPNGNAIYIDGGNAKVIPKGAKILQKFADKTNNENLQPKKPSYEELPDDFDDLKATFGTKRGLMNFLAENNRTEPDEELETEDFGYSVWNLPGGHAAISNGVPTWEDPGDFRLIPKEKMDILRKNADRTSLRKSKENFQRTSIPYGSQQVPRHPEQPAASVPAPKAMKPAPTTLPSVKAITPLQPPTVKDTVKAAAQVSPPQATADWSAVQKPTVTTEPEYGSEEWVAAKKKKFNEGYIETREERIREHDEWNAKQKLLAESAKQERLAKLPKPSLINETDPESGKVTFGLNAGDKHVGEIHFSRFDPILTETARTQFPDDMPEGTEAYRVKGIFVDNEYRGLGFGKQLYLAGYASHPEGSRFYNANTEPDGAATLDRLENDGLINLRRKNSSSRRNNPSHLAWLTPEGLAKGREILAKMNQQHESADQPALQQVTTPLDHTLEELRSYGLDDDDLQMMKGLFSDPKNGNHLEDNLNQLRQWNHVPEDLLDRLRQSAMTPEEEYQRLQPPSHYVGDSVPKEPSSGGAPKPVKPPVAAKPPAVPSVPKLGPQPSAPQKPFQSAAQPVQPQQASQPATPAAPPSHGQTIHDDLVNFTKFLGVPLDQEDLDQVKAMEFFDSSPNHLKWNLDFAKRLFENGDPERAKHFVEQAGIMVPNDAKPLMQKISQTLQGHLTNKQPPPYPKYLYDEDTPYHAQAIGKMVSLLNKSLNSPEIDPKLSEEIGKMPWSQRDVDNVTKKIEGIDDAANKGDYDLFDNEMDLLSINLGHLQDFHKQPETIKPIVEKMKQSFFKGKVIGGLDNLADSLDGPPVSEEARKVFEQIPWTKEHAKAVQKADAAIENLSTTGALDAASLKPILEGLSNDLASGTSPPRGWSSLGGETDYIYNAIDSIYNGFVNEEKPKDFVPDEVQEEDLLP